jgi:hypothetical protein
MNCIACKKPLEDDGTMLTCTNTKCDLLDADIKKSGYPDPYTPIIEGCEAALAEIAQLAYQNLGNAVGSAQLAGRKQAFEQVMANVRAQRGD